MGFAILGLMLAGILFASFSDGDTSDQESDAIDPAETPDEDESFVDGPFVDDGDNDEDLDIGASLVEDNGVVTVELGDDETGSLVMVNYVDSEDAGIGLAESHEARLYLMPEGSALPEGMGGGFGDVDLPDLFELDDLEDALGLQLLGSWDLGDVTPTSVEPYFIDTVVEPPEIQTDDPIAYFYVEANTDGDDIVTISETDASGTPLVEPIDSYNGVPAVEVTSDTTGTAGTDFFIVPPGTSGITVDGAGGDDWIETTSPDNTLVGGPGDDALIGYADNTTALGGSGDDIIEVGNGGEALGGSGDDMLRVYGDTTTATLVRGDGGDDGLSISGANTVGLGGAGDDFVGLSNGATGHGGAGDDHIQLDSGTIGFGGDGDDLFTIWNQFDDPDGPAMATGGAGADTFDALVWNPFGTPDDIYMNITDFDPAEDVLQVGAYQTTGVSVQSVNIVEAADGSYTDVEVLYANTQGLPPGTAVIRLDGVTGFSADQVVITT